VGDGKCGSIIKNEISHDAEFHYYYLSLQKGDAVTIVAESAAVNYQNLLLDIAFISPNGNIIVNWRYGTQYTYDNYEIQQVLKSTKTVQTEPLPETGIYRIAVIGFTNTGSDYTFYVGCKLRDGTVINPGDAVVAPTPPPLSGGAAPTPAFSGNGFPGLPPVDFANALLLPLTLGTSSVGKIPPGADAIFGFQFAANEGDKLDLSFKRTAGNLNLGLVVLSPDNKVAYMAALVTSDTMSTTFTLPSSGDYTIGIFRIDLVPPASPEATGFEILAAKG